MEYKFLDLKEKTVVRKKSLCFARTNEDHNSL